MEISLKTLLITKYETGNLLSLTRHEFIKVLSMFGKTHQGRGYFGSMINEVVAINAIGCGGMWRENTEAFQSKQWLFIACP